MGISDAIASVFGGNGDDGVAAAAGRVLDIVGNIATTLHAPIFGLLDATDTYEEACVKVMDDIIAAYPKFPAWACEGAGVVADAEARALWSDLDGMVDAVYDLMDALGLPFFAEPLDTLRKVQTLVGTI